METRRVIIIGDTLFAETLTPILNTDAVEVIGAAPTFAAALALLKTKIIDAVIIASAGPEPADVVGQCLAAFPGLPLIRADLDATDVQLITSQRIGARTADLLKTITALPRRS